MYNEKDRRNNNFCAYLFKLDSAPAQKLMINYSYKLYDAFTPTIDLLDKVKGHPCYDMCGRRWEDGESGRCSDQCNNCWCNNGGLTQTTCGENCRRC